MYVFTTVYIYVYIDSYVKILYGLWGFPKDYGRTIREKTGRCDESRGYVYFLRLIYDR